jgi:hypothetical protein
MAESGVERLISPLVTQQELLVRLLEFWEQRCVLSHFWELGMTFFRIEVDSK